MDIEFIEFENIKPFKLQKREYQVNIFESIKNKNSLVVLPTGLGKTIIAILAIAYKAKYGKVLFLAPTKPLCEQHYSNIKEITTLDGIFLITGEKTKKEKRKEIYKVAKIIVATPQTIENDIDIIEWEKFSLVIFDEVHRAVGNYAYVSIAKKCNEYGIQVIGLTASPGSSYSRLKEVIENLNIENIEVRSENDRDVKPYIAERKMKWLLISMPDEIKKLTIKIDLLIKEMLKELKNYVKISPRITKKMLIELQEKLQKNLDKSGSYYNAISIVSSIIKVYYLKELLTSQSIDATKEYIKKIEIDPSKAALKIRKNLLYREIKRDILNLKFENPKMKIVKKIVLNHLKERENARIIIFAEYRDTIESIIKELRNEGIRATKFIGQAKHRSNGMKQDEQKKVLKMFKNGEYNVLVSTSIGEEGIDIPATSLVLFYEPVPSAIRYIQRRGRTARAGIPGEVYILIMKGSRDEAYYWSSKRKEAKMMKHIKKLEKMIGMEKKEKKIKIKGQTSLDIFD